MSCLGDLTTFTHYLKLQKVQKELQVCILDEIDSCGGITLNSLNFSTVVHFRNPFWIHMQLVLKNFSKHPYIKKTKHFNTEPFSDLENNGRAFSRLIF